LELRGRPAIETVTVEAGCGVPSGTRTVRVDVAGKRLTVPAADAGEPFNQASSSLISRSPNRR
jgi:hypothetical protein